MLLYKLLLPKAQLLLKLRMVFTGEKENVVHEKGPMEPFLWNWKLLEGHGAIPAKVEEMDRDAAEWRKGRDSNPRGNFRPPTALAKPPLQPLEYPSTKLLEEYTEENFNYQLRRKDICFIAALPSPSL